GNTDSGNTDSGNTDSGNTDSGNTDSGNTDSGNTDSGNTDSGNTETVTAYTRDFYKITYDLAGGEFIDGTTEREQWVTSDKAIGSFETVPIKEGYKFTGWLKEGQKFNFSVKPTSDITLVASYEAFEDSDKYQCNEGDKFDPTTMKCYKILADNANKDMYSYTTYSYDANEVFCYAYNSGVSDGGIYPRVESSISIFGKNNVTYSGFEGQDDWLSNDSCKIASKCTNSQSESYDACSYTFSAIVYHSYDPVNLEEDIDIPSNGEDGSNSDNDSSDGGKTDEELTDKDAEDLKTGDALIILVWIVGISALGYTAYYFIRRNREN
ncbi:MAG: InlB B-repeat-containing protein, partial [Bacilli bacterium]|nr:InlB B-repeat-containing protein [Bacilli bacterium]